MLLSHRHRRRRRSFLEVAPPRLGFPHPYPGSLRPFPALSFLPASASLFLLRSFFSFPRYSASTAAFVRRLSAIQRILLSARRWTSLLVCLPQAFLGGSVPNFRSTRRRVQELGLSKSAMPSSSRSGGQAVLIVVEDDDDDVQVSSPRSVAQARSSACSRPHRPVHIPVLDDEDLELRLGPAGLGPAVARQEPSLIRPEPSSFLSAPNLQGAYFDDLSLNAANDLTIQKNNFEVKHGIAGKRKQWEPLPEPSKELKLTCAICMDTMKDETSTVCGHLFCKKCITTAIQAQKKCPTCRKKLSSNQIHRIYLSGSTS